MGAQPILLPGDPAPWFTARSSVNPQHRFDRAAGNYLALTFLRRSDIPEAQALLQAFVERGSVFDDVNARWFIVTGEENAERLPLRLPGIRAFFDDDGAIRRLYGLADDASVAVTFLLSPRLQVIGSISEPDPARHAEIATRAMAAQVPVTRLVEVLGPPPILVIPHVFEPALCRMLIDGYRKHGGEQSGFMVDEGGKTTQKFNPGVKVRKDWIIEEPRLCDAIGARIQRRIVPEIQKAYNVHIRHMERHLVGCYEAGDGGHFSAHRDNEALGAAHRQFACSLNLNAEEYEGGDLTFPEFGPQSYRPPTGGCVIFSCTLLHAATKVRSGTRYVFLPFLHDDAGEAIRRQNFKHLAAGPPVARAGSAA